ncbi:MAG: response regulator [Ignavibacteriaceae bacterium]|nr:response regulator [Ignavibacteriaceae bacterium]
MKLAVKFRLMVFAVMAIIFGILFYLQGVLHNEAITEELNDRASTVANVLASSVQKAFVENKFDELNHSVENVGKQKEIAFIVVFDNVGTKISVYHDTLLIPAETRTLLFANEKQLSQILLKYNLNKIRVPIIDEGHLWGNITLIFDQSSIKSQLDGSRNYSLYLFILGIIAVIVATIFLTRYISVPLEKLQVGVDKISEGDLDVKVLINRNDEIGNLASAFNKMSTSINEMIRELSEKNKALSDATSRLGWLSRIASQVGEGVIVTDLGGIITFVNNAWIKIHGYSDEDFVGKHISTFFTKNQFETEFLPLTEKVITNEQFSGEVFHLHADGHAFPTESTATLLKDKSGNNIGIIQIAIDITQRKENEYQLIIQREKAEESNRLKSSFLANMSHELRTPMFGILGYSEILMESEEDAAKKIMMETIFQSGTRLLETLNLILDLSKIEADKVEIKLDDVDIVNTVEDAIRLFAKAAENKGLKLEFNSKPDNLVIKIDERLLRESLSNLINNAIKYTNVGSINVQLDIADLQNKKCAVIKVSDTGIGIPENSKHLIFEEFRQVSEGFNRSFEGTGLGLSITKKFIEKMNGTITVESEVGVGSVFTLSFPIEESENQITSLRKEKPAIDVYEETNLKSTLPAILVVENDEINQSIIKLYLKKKYEVEIVSTGEDGIAKVNEKKYDAIMMDINLGRGMNGLEAAQTIRKISGYEATPIIAVTAFAMTGDKLEFLSKGCTHYIAKPFSKVDILTLLKSIVK